MKKHTAIHLLGGTASKAARETGYSRQGVAAWATDSLDNLRSRRVVDSVLAALSRQMYHLRRGKDVKVVQFDEATLDELMVLPPDDDSESGEGSEAQVREAA